jgi:ABC-type uncharacterized transport system ATPase subunit
MRSHSTFSQPNTISPPELEVREITKMFGNVVALDRVSMQVKPGTFQALLGENGAGKSTLVKCIMGFYHADRGEILIGGRSQRIDNPKDAHQFGVGMVYQQFTSIPAMTVAENLVLSRRDRGFFINWQQEYKNLAMFMETSPFPLPLKVSVDRLAAGQKQKLEILKQLYLKSRILILDEPTSVLTPQEADEILGLLREEVTAGRLSVLLITHKFREVMAFADEVTVLRKGHLAGSGKVQDLSISDLAEMMLGKARKIEKTIKIDRFEKVPILEVRNLHANKDNGLAAVKGVNIAIAKGEIVGIAGVSGNGQKEFIEVLTGQRIAMRGEILVSGEVYHGTRKEMRDRGVFSLPEEPLQNACVPQMSVAENMALRTFDRPPQTRWKFLLIFREIRRMARSLIAQFSIKTSSPDSPISTLSGGNIQRAVLARELSSETIKLLIAANPCTGLDFAAVEYIRDRLITARNDGVAILLVSEDLEELLELSDRLLVMSEGKFVYESPISEADFTAIGRAMAGH